MFTLDPRPAHATCPRRPGSSLPCASSAPSSVFYGESCPHGLADALAERLALRSPSWTTRRASSRRSSVRRGAEHRRRPAKCGKMPLAGSGITTWNLGTTPGLRGHPRRHCPRPDGDRPPAAPPCCPLQCAIVTLSFWFPCRFVAPATLRPGTIAALAPPPRPPLQPGRDDRRPTDPRLLGCRGDQVPGLPPYRRPVPVPSPTRSPSWPRPVACRSRSTRARRCPRAMEVRLARPPPGARRRRLAR